MKCQIDMKISDLKANDKDTLGSEIGIIKYYSPTALSSRTGSRKP